MHPGPDLTQIGDNLRMHHLRSVRISALLLVALCLVVATFAACGIEGEAIPTPTGDAAPPLDGSSNDDGSNGAVDASKETETDSGDSGPRTVYGLDSRPSNATCKAFTAPPRTGQIHLVDRFPNVPLTTPTGMFQRPGDNTRWYVTERSGRIVYFPNNPAATAADVKVALDLRAVTSTKTDCSLAGVAFPPDFATSKHAYVGYCYRGPETTGTTLELVAGKLEEVTGPKLQHRVSRFATDDGGATFDPASEQVIFSIDFPYGNTHTDWGLHAGDALRFGKDGYLYLAVGDGGPQGKVGGGQAQQLDDLRGKLLRFDVSDLAKSLTKDFVAGRQRTAVDIPPDNPFVGLPNARPEIYAFGFRNPWQFNFDRKTNAIWLGDVGYTAREEINRDVKKGGNYGWGIHEGLRCTGFTYPEAGACNDPRYIEPLLNYPHATNAEFPDDQTGLAVTGGVVYRGSAVPSLAGAYLFGDSSKGRIWTVRDVDDLAPGQHPDKELLFTGVPVSSFAQDQDGEVFLVRLYGPAKTGAIYALVEDAAPEPATGGPPKLLSDTGCFEKLDPKEPVPALVPFHPNAELWSDNATKRRWMALPDGKQIAVKPDGDFEFPNGSVLVKEFSLGTRKVETRFFVRQEADDRWAGYTYVWNDAQTDAQLLGENAEKKTIESQTWTFPGRADCHSCHTSVAGTTLGLELAQLNHDMVYPSTSRTANQLATLSNVGFFTTALPSEIPSLATLDGPKSVEERTRSYLHVNCSNCHRPDGPTFTPLDLRFATPLAQMGICDERPTIDDLPTFISTEPRLLAPGAPSRSVLWVRLSTVDSAVRMPPLGRSITHAAASTLVGDWITSTTVCPTP